MVQNNDDMISENSTLGRLFGQNSKAPYNSAIVRKWVNGCSLSYIEELKVTELLIHYPDLVQKFNKESEFFELIRYALQQTDVQNPENLEKGLYLYTLLYLQLKSGANSNDSFQTISLLERLFTYYYLIDERVLKFRNPESMIVYADNTNDILNYKDKLTFSYLKIISKIYSLNALLSLDMDFNLHKLPLPYSGLSDVQCKNLQYEALKHFNRKEYSEASHILKMLCLSKFELPNVLYHLARIELAKKDLTQAMVFVRNAWRIRNKEPHHSTCCVLFCGIILQIVKSEPFMDWLGCLKFLLLHPMEKNNSIVWDIESLVDDCKNDLTDAQVILLRSLADVIAGKKHVEIMFKIKIWRKTQSLTIEEFSNITNL